MFDAAHLQGSTLEQEVASFCMTKSWKWSGCFFGNEVDGKGKGMKAIWMSNNTSYGEINYSRVSNKKNAHQKHEKSEGPSSRQKIDKIKLIWGKLIPPRLQPWEIRGVSIFSKTKRRAKGHQWLGTLSAQRTRRLLWMTKPWTTRLEGRKEGRKGSTPRVYDLVLSRHTFQPKNRKR